MINKILSNYRLLIVGGLTDGLTDFFTGVDLTSIRGRTALIKNIKFIPRFKENSSQNPEIQYLDETGAGNNMDLVSPASVNPNQRIITANVEFDGIDFKFLINGKSVQLVESTTKLLTFDTEFKNVNIYIPDKIETMSMFAEELIYSDVTAGTTSNYILQVNIDMFLDPSDELLSKLVY